MRSIFLATCCFLATTAAGTALAQTPSSPARPAASAAQPAKHETVQVVEAFMAALAEGKLEAARNLMTPDAVVMSNGQVLGNRDAYIDGTAKGDAAALRGVKRELVNRGASANTDIGWVISEKRMHDAQAKRELRLTETMVLAKTPAGWKITHIHWSGRAAG